MRARFSSWACRLVCLTVCVAAWPAAAFAQAPDADGDGLPDAWEIQFGLNPSSASGGHGAGGDPDGDGFTNAQEMAAGTHPRGMFTRTFAEGATGDLFDLQFALFNPDASRTAIALVRYLTSSGTPVAEPLVLPPLTRVTLNPETIPALTNTALSTVIESDLLLAVDRTMSWDERRYGSHAETGAAWPSTTWFFAEGATHSGFDLFYLIQNPNTAPATVDVTYLLPAGAPLQRRYIVAPGSRFNIWVKGEDPALAATDVSATLASSLPIVAERAMYLTSPGRLFEAGHASAGITAPALEWFLAEGATGEFFDLFVLVANPTTEDADVRLRYLLPDGVIVVKRHPVPARSRRTFHVDGEDSRLASTAVSTMVESLNGVPVLVERAMWWPGPGFGEWRESHNSAGSTAAALRWALAEGEEGGPFDTRTYVLVANVGDTAGNARVTLYFEGGDLATADVPLPARSRTTIDVRATFPDAVHRRFATLVESRGAAPAPLVVERAMYSDAAGERWAAGTNALGTPLDAGGMVGGTALPVVSVQTIDGTASERGAQPGHVVFSRSTTTGPLTILFTLVGSAGRDDVEAGPFTMTFPPDVATMTRAIVPIDDNEIESDETVVVALAQGPGYRVGRAASAVVTILDDDVPAGSGAPPSTADAVRLLNQAAFGPTVEAVHRVRALGVEGWIDEQMRAPRSEFLAYLDGVSGEEVAQRHVQEAWFQAAVTGPDQLRQRVANALLEIMVVSNASGLQNGTVAFAAYMDLLMRHAFGDVRVLLEDVTLSPTMGRYLDALQNDRENPATGRIPNENYARELLQLFSIGQYRLRLDGSLDPGPGGAPQLAYEQAEVEGFARVFTGWTFHQAQPPFRFRGVPAEWRHPMIAIAANHSRSEKRLLGGAVIPASGASDPHGDLAIALDNVFRHPNVGPFIGRQLVQRLVTSNPSPAYVARVAAVFNDNGRGMRGDLAAVVKAILLDDEARSAAAAAHPHYGHLREPMIRFVSALRAFRGRAASGKFPVWNLERTMGQAPFRAPSVFNFFAPDYAPAGAIADAGLAAPEFQITTETTAVSGANTMRDLVHRGFGSGVDQLRLDLAPEQTLAGTPGALIDRLDLLLLGGTMSPGLRAIVLDAVTAIPAARALDRARLAVHLVLSSPEYLVQK
jgi:uncharacterized protein (DUF1800 family)